MDHFRGFQDPAYIIPGAPDFPGHPQQIRGIDPPFIVPTGFLTEIIAVIRSEFATQTQFICGQYSDVKRSYAEVSKQLREHGVQFGARLDGIKGDMGQFHGNQVAITTALTERSDSLESATKASLNALDSKMASVVEAIEHGFGEIKKGSDYGPREPSSFDNRVTVYNASLGDYLRGSRGALFPANWSRTNSEGDTVTSHTLPDPAQLDRSTPLPRVATLSEPSTSSGSNLDVEEQDQLLEEGAPPVSTTATGEPTVPPTAEDNFVVLGRCPSQDALQDLAQDPPRELPQDPPPQNYLYDTPSPLTRFSTPCSWEDAQTPVALDEDESPLTSPIPTPSPQKRKRTSCGQKRSRKSQKAQTGKARDLARSPVGRSGEDDANDQKYISCDRCAGWFHYGCVGLQGDHEDGAPWECPPCTRNPARGVVKGFREGNGCSLPGCNLSRGGEYFIDKLVGRCYDPNEDKVKYLVAYEGYRLHECTWEPSDHFADDSAIKEFLNQWATENTGTDVESLDPHESIFLSEVGDLAHSGLTWLGI